MNSKFVPSFLLLVAVTLVYSDPFESTHLVTMRKDEMMEILDCLAKDPTPEICHKFDECEKKLPKQVMFASTECRKKYKALDFKQCNHYEPLFESPAVPMKIFDCVVESTHKLNAEENKMMVEFEECIREFHASTCKFPKHNEEIFW